MIEIVAFFFLNLYRTGLSEIKYFQNEITNSDYKIMGLMASSYDKSHKAILDSGKILMNVERNYLLKKRTNYNRNRKGEDGAYSF